MSSSKENRQSKVRIVEEIHLLSFRLARFPDTVLQSIPMSILRKLKQMLEEQVFRLFDSQGDMSHTHLSPNEDDAKAPHSIKKIQSQESEKK